jgi:hypothetical protein
LLDQSNAEALTTEIERRYGTCGPAAGNHNIE